MPEGVMEWFDPATGTGRLAKGGHRYVVHATDVEPAARAPGARVHFDIDRHRRGVAVNVTSRRGHRSRPRHRRFGDLTGARRPDAKGPKVTDPFETPLVGREAHPAVVARAWAARVAAGDVDGATRLCAPDAVVHTTEGDATGRASICEQLAAWPYTGSGLEPADTAGGIEPGTLRLTWPGWGPGRTTMLRIEHGEVTAAWIDGGPVEQPALAPDVEEGFGIETSTTGLVTEWAKQYAIDRVRHVAEHARGPVLFARVKLRRLVDPAARRPALAEAMLDVNGQAMRAHAAAGTMTEAIDQTAGRLRQRLQAQPPWSRDVGALPEAGEWRHGNRPTPRPEWFDRPPDQRQLVRQKTIAVRPLSVEEALFDMDLLDYDFYLFNDLASGQDGVLWRRPDGLVELSTLRSDGVEQPAASTPLVLHATTAPTLTLKEAIDWLDLAAERFLFFADATDGRGHLLYRRYDGHYGLLEPAP